MGTLHAAGCRVALVREPRVTFSLNILRGEFGGIPWGVPVRRGIRGWPCGAGGVVRAKLPLVLVLCGSRLFLLSAVSFSFLLLTKL